MKRILSILSALAAIAPLSCEPVQESGIPSTPLVVDGWIDAGGHPVVMVTRSVSPTGSLQDDKELASKVVSYASVYVDDGTKRVQLEGRRDDSYFPPYIYTSDAITGEAGRSYRLEVVYPGINAWAETTVPAPIELDSLPVHVSGRADSLYTVTACFRDNPSTKDYYKCFTMVEGVNTSWTSSFLGAVDDATVQGEYMRIPVVRGWDILEMYRQPLFRLGEKVHIKFCTIDEVSYKYWTGYDDVTGFARNPFFPVSANVATNMHGALGFWGGYGSSEYYVEIR